MYVKNVDILKDKNLIKEEAESTLTNVTPVIIGETSHLKIIKKIFEIRTA